MKMKGAGGEDLEIIGAVVVDVKSEGAVAKRSSDLCRSNSSANSK